MESKDDGLDDHSHVVDAGPTGAPKSSPLDPGAGNLYKR